MKCSCPCSPEEHGPRGCKTWFGDRNTGFKCDCDWRPEVIEEVKLTPEQSDKLKSELARAMKVEVATKDTKRMKVTLTIQDLDPKKLTKEQKKNGTNVLISFSFDPPIKDKEQIPDTMGMRLFGSLMVRADEIMAESKAARAEQGIARAEPGTIMKLNAERARKRAKRQGRGK